MICDGIPEMLFSMRDEAYADFQRKLIPDTALPVIGVRTPAIRKYAAELCRRADANAFLTALPHTYFDENQLHAFMISRTRDFSAGLEQVQAFLPFVDCWATCDTLAPASFAGETARLLEAVDGWLADPRPYIERFGVKMLMSHFLGERFMPECADRVVRLRSDNYYVNMMRAWYIATALAKNKEQTLPLLEERRLDVWTHNKAVQKALESFRITAEDKALLRSLKIR